MENITRRSALLALSGAAVGVGLPQAAADGVSGKLRAAIAQDRAARDVSEELWCELRRLQTAHPMPTPKVQHSYHRSVDANGQEIQQPIYAYSTKDLEATILRDWELSLLLCGRGDARRAKINEEYQARLAAKLADFQRQEAEIAAAEDACGITAIHEQAQAASARVEATFAAVLLVPIETMSDVRAIAAYLVDLEKQGAEGIDTETLVQFIEALAGEA
ncbi:MAG TPA: hypothetical protein VGN97_16985 [Mesorhizobium sp.]|jgi:hypothetical protein|nr:hypothetical protein [Mesorhizobium sp.]